MGFSRAVGVVLKVSFESQPWSGLPSKMGAGLATLTIRASQYVSKAVVYFGTVVD
jgi:hypothetical protein